MRYFLLIFVLSSILFSACRGGEAENVNANVNQIAENVNADTNTNAVKKDEPVPTFSDAAVALAEGNKYLDLSENEKAIEAYRQAVALDPDLAEAHFQLGIAYALVEKEEDVVEDKLPGEVEETSQKKSKKPVKEKKSNSDVAFENAIKLYKKVVAKKPKDDVAFYNLGRAYNKLDEDEDAQKALQSAVKLQPENGEYQTEYGMILIKLAQYDEAIRALKKAVELDETNLRAEDLLEQAQAGKKRVDFGANMITPRLAPTESKEPRPTRRSKDPKESRASPEPKVSKTP
ncbi:MAG: tetratricopeptide repeat protein [Pyrinomonadaceae bacterium]